MHGDREQTVEPSSPETNITMIVSQMISVVIAAVNIHPSHYADLPCSVHQVSDL